MRPKAEGEPGVLLREGRPARLADCPVGGRPAWSWLKRLRLVAGRAFDGPLGRVRALLRADELAFVALAIIVGALAGSGVALMSRAAQLLHELLFAIPAGAHLSATTGIAPWRLLLVPAVGGLALGGLMLATDRLRLGPAIDPIEANALYGGRMSLLGSLVVALQTVLSNGVGASIGLEAGYTQLGAGAASRLGAGLRLRRNDLRTLVGCGAAGAIGAAFLAPLAGAFYAFELIIGGYTISALAPVVGSALAGTTVAQMLAAHATPVEITSSLAAGWRDQLLFLSLSFVAALAGIGLMLGVTLTERLFRSAQMPRALRPVLGGSVVGLLALLHPQVLSSGHGALDGLLAAPLPVAEIALILLTKSVASAVSIGSGFRGGLFFASLFMGGLLGGLAAVGVALVAPDLHPDPHTYAIVGMGSMAVSVVGGPLTMLFLTLETTGDFLLAPSLVAAVLVATLTSRRLFGYSFATWRFHLRGEAIRSAHDIGWIRNLTVGRLMRRDVRTVRADTLLSAFRRQFPLGSTSQVVALDAAERYAGMVLLAEAHAPELDEKAADIRIDQLLRYRDHALTPSMNVKDAVARLEQAGADALAVVDEAERGRVLGLLSEAHALRRYSEELDRRRRELVGEVR